MTNEYILVPHRWRRILGIIRVALAASSLVMEGLSPDSSPLPARLILILFLLYAVVATSWRILERVRYATFSLIVDSIFFLICSLIPSEYSVWLSAVFYVYLLSSALLIHPWKTVAIVACVLPLLFALVQPAEHNRLVPVLGLVGVLGLVSARNRQLLIERLIGMSRKAVLYRAEAYQARNSERERIAADFHDGPQQSFISLQMRLEVLRRVLEKDPEQAKEELAQLQALTRSQIGEVRAFVRSMLPAAVDGTSLTATIGQQVAVFEKDSGIPTEFHGEGNVEIQDQNTSRELQHILREALHNAQKHSGAGQIRVGLEETDGGIVLTVSDDGSGFPFEGVYGMGELENLQIGPKSIRRRVRGLGGELTVSSRSGAGAEVKVQVSV